MATVLKNTRRPRRDGNRAGKKPGTRRRVSSRASPRKPKAGKAKGVAVVKTEPTESKDAARAKLAMQPSVTAGLVIAEFALFRDLDVSSLADHLKDGMNDVNKNDLQRCEEMLYCQAHALEAIFVSLVHRADRDWMNKHEEHLRLALKAQNQCRMTVETLAQIKNPPMVFARQANIAQGPQQVNNAMMPAGEPRARGKNENTPNKLSEGSNELLPDTPTPGAAVGSDPAMATLGTFDRAKVRRG